MSDLTPERLAELIEEAEHKPGEWCLYHNTGVKFVELSLRDYRLAAVTVNTLPDLLTALEAATAERKRLREAAITEEGQCCFCAAYVQGPFDEGGHAEDCALAGGAEAE